MVSQYAIDNRGALPTAITATVAAYTISSSYNTGYQISKDATSNRVTVSAPSAELSETITVTK